MTSDVFGPIVGHGRCYHVQRFLPYNDLFSGVILDLPTLKLDIINGRSRLWSVSLIEHSFLLQIQHHLQFLILNDLSDIQFHSELFQPGDRYPEVSEHGTYLWFALLSHAR